MSSFKIISDSTCDLSPDLIRRHDIDIVPLYVNFGEDSYRDGIDLTVPQMYAQVKERGFLPKTSAATPGDFIEAFRKYVDRGIDILYLGIGAKLSASFTSASLARSELATDRIFLIDSENLSSGSGLLLLKAASFRAAGDSIESVYEKITALVPKVRTQFVINTMEYLYKGGRCSPLAAVVGTILKIKPIIKMKDGTLHVGKKPHGRIQTALDVLVDEVLDLKNQLDPEFLMVTHSMANDSAAYIMDRLRGRLPVKNTIETDAGCVISSHCGEGCIGILYILQ
jgi:DegV family protein with EDD domain